MRLIFLDALRELSWSGIPTQYRSSVWGLLSVSILLKCFCVWPLISCSDLVQFTLQGYLPGNSDRRATTLSHKRAEYAALVTQYYGSRLEEAQQPIFHQVSFFVSFSEKKDSYRRSSNKSVFGGIPAANRPGGAHLLVLFLHLLPSIPCLSLNLTGRLWSESSIFGRFAIRGVATCRASTILSRHSLPCFFQPTLVRPYGRFFLITRSNSISRANVTCRYQRRCL